MPQAGAEHIGQGTADTAAEGEFRPPNLEGQTVAGKYALGRLLGSGGMGAVYEARNTATCERCAVKLLLRGGLERESAVVKRFLREATATSRLDTEHIVRIHDSGLDSERGWPFLVMELLDGEDFEHVLERSLPLRPNAVVEIVLQACAGLARAHETGIVHRDIKPANLFLERRPGGGLRVKLLDFGVAKVQPNGHEGARALTRSGSMLGTPLYMSPEQIRKAAQVDAASDVWSLGVLMWTALCGTVPYSETTSLGALLACIITEPIPYLQDRAPWVPAELAAITHRALARDLAQRFRDARELEAALLTLIPPGVRVLDAESLVSVSNAERKRAAPRPQLAAGSTSSAARARVRRSRVGLAVALGCTALVGGGIAASRIERERSTAANAAPSARAAVHGATAASPISPEILKFSFRVAPPDAEVTVDGRTARVHRDRVEIDGRLGTIRSVRLRHAGAEQHYEIALTERGAVPNQLSLVVRKPAPRKARVPPAAVSATKVTSDVTLPAASAVRRLDTSFDEFK